MSYIDTQTAAYPVSESEIRAAFPNTSFPTPFVPPDRYKFVFQTPRPSFDAVTETARETAPALTQLGTYEQRWEVVPLDQAQADANLAAARERKVAQIKAERDRRCQQGGFPAAGKWFHSDTFSRSQQLGLVLLGQNIPANLMWKTMDGSFVLMTPTLAQQIFASAAAQDAATFQRAEELQVFANTQPNPDGLQLTGWPPIFGE